MTELLTREEYGAIAASLTPATTAFIDGGFRPAVSGRTFASVNPATGVHLADVAACGSEDVDIAVAKAREAFDDGRAKENHHQKGDVPGLEVLQKGRESVHQADIILSSVLARLSASRCATSLI